MLLKSIEIENFKCFGKRVTIPLAPITLIYGENSAGKSSILQALNLLKQTSEHVTGGNALLSRCENGLVDLGRYEDFIHDHVTGDLRMKLTFQQDPRPSDMDGTAATLRNILEGARSEKVLQDLGVDPDVYDVSSRFRSERIQKEGFSYEMSFQHEPSTSRTILTQLDISIGDTDPGSVIFTKQPSPQFALAQTGCLHPVSRQCTKEVCLLFSKQRQSMLRTIELMLPFVERYQGYGITATELADLRRFYSKPFSHKKFCEHNRTHTFYHAIDSNSFIATPMPTVLPHDDYIFLLSLLPEDEQKGRLEPMPDSDLPAYIDPEEYRLREIMPNEELATSVPDPRPTAQSDPPDGSANALWRCWSEEDIRGTAALRGQPSRDVLDWEMGKIGDELRSFLNGLIPITPVRPAPERWYEEGNPLVQLPLHNSWLRTLTQYECTSEPLGPAVPGGFVLKFFDTRKKDRVGVTMADVGYGISQIAPLIVECLGKDSKCITIEQPEVHIHPKLQAELGNLLAYSSARGKQFIIETHSEHLMLRIQKLIRKELLDPKKVSVLFVSRGEDGSSVQQLRINEQGEFLDEWPGGFFEEGFNEMFGD